MMVFMSLVLVVIGPFCCDSIGREDLGVFHYWSVVVLLSIRLLFVRLRLMSSISRLYGAGNCLVFKRDLLNTNGRPEKATSQITFLNTAEKLNTTLTGTLLNVSFTVRTTTNESHWKAGTQT